MTIRGAWFTLPRIHHEVPMKSAGRRHPVLCSLMAAAVTAISSAASAAGPVTRPTVLETPPDYSQYKEVATAPLAYRQNFGNLRSTNVRISINDGTPMNFQVDTGSTGIIVGASEVPGYDPNGLPGEITYSSSGISHYGVYNTVKVTFVDSKGPDGRPVSASVPVLVSIKGVRRPGAVNSGNVATTQEFVPKPHMMGIGFGRGGKESHAERNPFLNLDAMKAGTMRRGYTITRQGFTFGLTKESVGDGYLFQQLEPRTPSKEMAEFDPKLKDWAGAPAWVTVNGKADPMGFVLMDTGLSNMMIGRPDTPEEPLPDGTPITVHLMDGKLTYDFEVGDRKNPTTPTKVTRTNRPFVYVNTGLKALAVFDYLYDAEGGYLGLRPTERPKVPASVTNPRPATTRPPG